MLTQTEFDESPIDLPAILWRHDHGADCSAPAVFGTHRASALDAGSGLDDSADHCKPW